MHEFNAELCNLVHSFSSYARVYFGDLFLFIQIKNVQFRLYNIRHKQYLVVISVRNSTYLETSVQFMSLKLSVFGYLRFYRSEQDFPATGTFIFDSSFKLNLVVVPSTKWSCWLKLISWVFVYIIYILFHTSQTKYFLCICILKIGIF